METNPEACSPPAPTLGLVMTASTSLVGECPCRVTTGHSGTALKLMRFDRQERVLGCKQARAGRAGIVDVYVYNSTSSYALLQAISLPSSAALPLPVSLALSVRIVCRCVPSFCFAATTVTHMGGDAGTVAPAAGSSPAGRA